MVSPVTSLHAIQSELIKAGSASPAVMRKRYVGHLGPRFPRSFLKNSALTPAMLILRPPWYRVRLPAALDLRHARSLAQTSSTPARQAISGQLADPQPPQISFPASATPLKYARGAFRDAGGAGIMGSFHWDAAAPCDV